MDGFAAIVKRNAERKLLHPTIRQLEDLLNEDDERAITILPNGEVLLDGPRPDLGRCKPLTFREDLGGEYRERPS